jgi:hypothetical protein
VTAYDNIRARVALQTAAYQVVTRGADLLADVSKIGVRQSSEGLLNDCLLAGEYVEAFAHIVEVRERLSEVEVMLRAGRDAAVADRALASLRPVAQRKSEGGGA